MFIMIRNELWLVSCFMIKNRKEICKPKRKHKSVIFCISYRLKILVMIGNLAIDLSETCKKL